MYKALIIDDEKSSRLLISKLGRWNDYGIEPPFVATNGADGLTMIKDLHPNIVFVDMQMPIMDGNEFLRRASVSFPTIKYIVVSGHDEFSYVKTALQTRAIDYLLKPISGKDLNEVIALVVSQLNSESTVQDFKVKQSEAYNTAEIPEIIKNYLDENYTTEINLNDISEKYFFTKEYLSKLFKKCYGIGIYEYVLSLRMRRAKELLLCEDMQIQQISDLLGYSNSNYFSKAFKNYYSISPSDYREDSIGKRTT